MAGLNGSLEYALDDHGLKPIGCMVIKIRHHEEGFHDLSDKKTIRQTLLDKILAELRVGTAIEILRQIIAMEAEIETFGC